MFRQLKKLTTPQKIQDFLNKLPFDHRAGDKIDRSVKGILQRGRADCAGGAILAAEALIEHGRKAYLLDLKTARGDFDHVVTLFKEGKFWGALSKTNHAVLRYREPVYRDVRELVMSYFHEYFLPNGKKTLRSYAYCDISKYGTKLLTDKNTVTDIIHKLDNSLHIKILSNKQVKQLRKADGIEVKAGNIVQYKK